MARIYKESYTVCKKTNNLIMGKKQDLNGIFAKEEHDHVPYCYTSVTTNMTVILKLASTHTHCFCECSEKLTSI